MDSVAALSAAWLTSQPPAASSTAGSGHTGASIRELAPAGGAATSTTSTPIEIGNDHEVTS